jgi:regulator of nucleoside diphosphate kinase
MTNNQRTCAPSETLNPRITLTTEDFERLSSLARAAMKAMPELASGLVDELDRAHVVGTEDRAADIVCMGSEVEFRDESTGRIQTMILVYPNEADITRGRISVLTPVGTALIGLGVGQPIAWETRDGNLKRLTVLRVGKPGTPEPGACASHSIGPASPPNSPSASPLRADRAQRHNGVEDGG